jgi:hypothetical protein
MTTMYVHILQYEHPWPEEIIIQHGTVGVVWAVRTRILCHIVYTSYQSAPVSNKLNNAKQISKYSAGQRSRFRKFSLSFQFENPRPVTTGDWVRLIFRYHGITPSQWWEDFTWILSFHWRKHASTKYRSLLQMLTAKHTWARKRRWLCA